MPVRRGSHLTRRHALQSLATAASVIGVATRATAQPASATPPPTPRSTPALPEMARPEFPRPTLHVYETYGWLRGFNCIPSWAARIEDAWWFYDAAKMREEMALARSVSCQRHLPLDRIHRVVSRSGCNDGELPRCRGRHR